MSTGPSQARLDPTATVSIVHAVEELARRWRSARGGTLFRKGQAEGYVQAIAVLLDQPARNVRAALEQGKI